VPLELTDDLISRELAALVAAAVLSLILERTGQTGPDEVAGARAHQQIGYRSGGREQPEHAGAFGCCHRIRGKACR